MGMLPSPAPAARGQIGAGGAAGAGGGAEETVTADIEDMPREQKKTS
jgi:hypothetical protein